MNTILRKIACFLGIHDGRPSGKTVTCDCCGRTFALADVYFWRVGRHDEGEPSTWLEKL